jgi:hypothetical protein
MHGSQLGLLPTATSGGAEELTLPVDFDDASRNRRDGQLCIPIHSEARPGATFDKVVVSCVIAIEDLKGLMTFLIECITNLGLSYTKQP